MMQACEDLLKRCCRELANVPGDIAEIGVWKGESARCILAHTHGCKVYLYDTFTGFPPEMCLSGVDFHTAGGFNDTSLAEVEKRLQPYADRVVIRPGVFPATAMDDNGPFRLIHIDCDLYLSTKAAIEWAADRLSPGGLILSDDYYCGSTAGAKKAIDEWLHSVGDEWKLEKAGSRGIISKVQTEAIA